MSKLFTRNCLVCDKEFTTFPAADQKFCSRPCFYLTRRKSDAEYTSRYRMADVPEGHPLCPPGRRIHLHRLLLWDRIGAGPHPCHHCGVLVDWQVARSGGGLVVDHLDQNKLNNGPGNIVPSCYRCNVRSKDLDANPHKVRSDGKRRRAEQRNCTECGAEYLRLPCKDLRRHRFCSLGCSTRNRYRLAREARAAFRG